MNSASYLSKSFEDLSMTELYAILALRMQVFCVEQNCAYQDLDGQDQNAQHVFIKENNAILAYARILKGEQAYHIGRVVVHPQHRKKGLATVVMQASINSIKRIQSKQQKNIKIEISAQSYLTDFYQGLGFENTGKYYLEDDIPHEEMQLVID